MARSKDQLVNWIFARLIEQLNDNSNYVYVVFRKLRNQLPKKQNNGNYIGRTGQLDQEDNNFWRITIDPRIDEEFKARVFLHELLHLFFTETAEKDILKLEFILWPLLSTKQKNILAEYMNSLKK